MILHVLRTVFGAQKKVVQVDSDLIKYQIVIIVEKRINGVRNAIHHVKNVKQQQIKIAHIVEIQQLLISKWLMDNTNILQYIDLLEEKYEINFLIFIFLMQSYDDFRPQIFRGYLSNLISYHSNLSMLSIK